MSPFAASNRLLYISKVVYLYVLFFLNLRKIALLAVGRLESTSSLSATVDSLKVTLSIPLLR